MLRSTDKLSRWAGRGWVAGVWEGVCAGVVGWRLEGHMSPRTPTWGSWMSPYKPMGGPPSSSLLPESQVSTTFSPRQGAILGAGLQGMCDPSFCMQLIIRMYIFSGERVHGFYQILKGLCAPSKSEKFLVLGKNQLDRVPHHLSPSPPLGPRLWR